MANTKQYKQRVQKYKIFIRHDRANTEEMTNVGTRATLNGARKLARSRIQNKKDIYNWTADVSDIKTGKTIGQVVCHPKKGAFWITDKTTNYADLGTVPTAFPIAPDGSLLRPIGSTSVKKLAKEPAVSRRLVYRSGRRGRRASGVKQDYVVESIEDLLEE